MLDEIGDGGIHERSVIDGRCYTYPAYYLVPCLAFSVRPVEDIHEGGPADGLLLQIRGQDIGVEILVVSDLDLVLAQTILPVLQNTGRAARSK